MGSPPAFRFVRLPTIVAAFILLALACGRAGAQEAPLAWAVKATYLYKLSPFVDWPPDAFATPSSPLQICVVGDPVFGALVARAAAGENVSNHPVVVRRFSVEGDPSGCHVLYAGGPFAPEVLEKVRGRPVLTVTDAATGGEGRGVVHFVPFRGRVRFIIDLALAQQQGLSISSRVLELALRVIRGTQ